MKSITVVSGLWNLTDNLTDNLIGNLTDNLEFHTEQKQKFANLLRCEQPMCIYIDPADEDFVWTHRQKSNTKIFYKTLADFETWFEFFPLVQKISVSIAMC